MFINKKSSFFSLTLTILMVLALFLLLQPNLAQAKTFNNQTLSDNFSSYPGQSSKTGTIRGKLSFPSEQIPPLTIFAIRIDNGFSTYYSIETTQNQFSYAIDVDPGIYNVYAFRDDFAGGYTRYVTCGMGANCSDHSPVPVVVKAGKTVKNIHLKDWYAPAGTFPTRPDGLTQANSKTTCAVYHTVRWGETLYKIGLRYNLTWKPIAQANNIINPSRIFAGQTLCIPSTTRTEANPFPGFSTVPTFIITDVTRNKQVSIKTSGFPPYQDFKVTMGRMGTQGIDGIEVGETYSAKGGSFSASYTIPKALRGLDTIAIRFESSSGYYSYNWFYNNTTP
jgi:LysM repeat protein